MGGRVRGNLMPKLSKRELKNNRRNAHREGPYSDAFVCAFIVCVLKLDAKLFLCCSCRYRRPKLIKVKLVTEY